MENWVGKTERARLKSPLIMGDRDGLGLSLAPCGIPLELMGEAAVAAGGEHCLPSAAALGSGFRGNERWGFYLNL